MSDHIYKKVELVGSAKESIENAVENAVTKASKSIRNMRWLTVDEIRGHIVDGKVDHWQVGVKIGFTLEQEDAPETTEERLHEKKAEEALKTATGGKALTNE